MRNKKSNMKYALLGIAFLVLITPYILQSSTAPLSDEPYYHMRAAEKGLFLKGYDPLSFGGRPYIFNAYHVVLWAAIQVLPKEIAILSLSIFSGIVSIILLISFQKELKIKQEEIILFVGLVIISPTFLSVFSLGTPRTLAFVVLLGAIVSYVREKTFLTTILSILLVLLDPAALFVGLVFLWLDHLRSSSRLTTRILITLVGVGSVATLYLPLFYRFPLYNLTENVLQRNITDFGGIYGFGIFQLILGFLGFIKSWNNQNKNNMFFLGLTMLFVVCFFWYPAGIPYVSLFVAYFAAKGLYSISSMKWDLELVKQFTLITIFCGLLFSTLSFADRLSESGPPQPLKEILPVLHNKEGMVFAHPTMGFWVESLGEKPTYIDQLVAFNPHDIELRQNTADVLWESRNLERTKEILQEQNITFILINRAEENNGLSFLLRNNETFTPVARSKTFEVWQAILLP